MTRPIALAFALSALVGAVAHTQPRPADTVRWVWSGGVTSTSAVVKSRASRGGVEVRLEVVRAEGGGPAVPAQRAVSDGDGIAAFDVRALEPATRYEYRVSTGAAAALTGTFRTFGVGPWSFRLAFSACAETGSTSPVFDAIRNTGPDLFIHMGDIHYEDITRNDPDRFRRAFDAVMASPAQSRLYRTVPIAYTWDDHDFGGNGSDASSAAKPAAIAVYRQVVPHYRLERGGGAGINQAFSIGRVRVVMTDSRSQRGPSRGDSRRRTMLGAAQLAWLKDELSAAAGAPIVIWVNTVPWIASPGSGSDNWGSYAQEREAIASHIERLGLTRRLLMISGDAHMAAIDDGSHSNYASGSGRNGKGFVVMHAAPLDRSTSVKGGPYSRGVSARRGQFGLADITDDGATIRVELSGRDRAGAPITGMCLELRCSNGACATR